MESYWGGKPDPGGLDRVFADAKHILLCHEPDPFDDHTDARIALQLQAHARRTDPRAIPMGRWNYQAGGKNTKAVFTGARRSLFVASIAGSGTVDHHFRFNCPPEITLLELS
ncbi:MAG: hypothetical protein R3F11_18680 [Verrucomicrobiales bacterium]